MGEELKTEEIASDELAALRTKAQELETRQRQETVDALVESDAQKIAGAATENLAAMQRDIDQRTAARAQELMRQQMAEVAAKLRLSPRIEFPLVGREGNLSRGEKQLLDAVLGRKAMTIGAGAGYGVDWVPTEMSDMLIELVRLENRILANCQEFTWPADATTLRIPKLIVDPTAYYIATELSQAIAANPTTGYVELTGKKIGINIEFSGELTEDTVIPFIPTLKRNVGVKMADALEDVVVNGDTEATQASNINYSADTCDVTRALDGMRKHAWLDDASYSSACADISAGVEAGCRTIRKAMGRCAVRPDRLMWVTGSTGYLAMLGFTTVQTLEKFGQYATVLKGQLAAFDGVAVVPSQTIPKTAATGQVDAASNDYDVIMLVYRPYMCWGMKRAITVETDRNIQLDKNIIVASARVGFDVAITGLETSGAAIPIVQGYKVS